jgi:RsiW-degrading membrane proteinase PrsW (M82 family)
MIESTLLIVLALASQTLWTKYIEPEFPDKKKFYNMLLYLIPISALVYLYIYYDDSVQYIFLICGCFLILAILIGWNMIKAIKKKDE